MGLASISLPMFDPVRRSILPKFLSHHSRRRDQWGGTSKGWFLICTEISCAVAHQIESGATDQNQKFSGHWDGRVQSEMEGPECESRVKADHDFWSR